MSQQGFWDPLLVPPFLQTEKADLSDYLATLEGNYTVFRDTIAKATEKAVADARRSAAPVVPADTRKIVSNTDPTSNNRITPTDDASTSLQVSTTADPTTNGGVPAKISVPPDQGLCPFLDNFSRSTAFVSAKLFEEVVNSVVRSTAIRKLSHVEGAFQLPSKVRRKRSTSNALLALRMETYLRYQSKYGLPFSGLPYLGKVFDRSRQEVHDAAGYLRQHGIERAQGDRGQWNIVIPTTLEELRTNFIPVPEAAITVLSNIDFFALVALHRTAELFTRDAGNDVRRKIIPRRYRLTTTVAELANLTYLTESRLRKILRRLTNAGFFDIDKMALTPSNGQELIRGQNNAYLQMRKPKKATAADFAELRGE